MSDKKKRELENEIPRLALWQSEDGKRTIADLSCAIEELLVEGKRPGQRVTGSCAAASCAVEGQLATGAWRGRERAV